MLARRAAVACLIACCSAALAGHADPPEDPQFVCGTPAITPQVGHAVRAAIGDGSDAWPKTDLVIPVAVHLIRWGKKGDYPTSVVQTLIANMNWAFYGSGVQFGLVRLDRTNNKAWYQNCLGANEAKMKKKLAYYPADVLNIYSCFMPGGAPGLVNLGLATFPFGNYPEFRSYPENHYMQGVLVSPNTLPVTSSLPDYWYGITAAHEAGHWLGLLHTFMPGTIGVPGGCSEPGDYVSDTPVQDLPTGSCTQFDTCSQAGLDDYTNFMDYRPDQCADHFTPGQVQRMQGVIINYRPSLYN